MKLLKQVPLKYEPKHLIEFISSKKKQPNELISLIDQYRNKACCWYTQFKADKILWKLKELLTEEEYWQLVVAYSHYKMCGEGPKELYDVCKELRNKYNT